jgi:hypothetical protein
VVGNPAGPYAGSPGAYLVASLALLAYATLGIHQWLIDSAFYQPIDSPMSVARLRTLRAVIPAAAALVYGLLLSQGNQRVLPVVPFLAAVVLIVYPAIRVYEAFLDSARGEREPAVQAQKLLDSSAIHASISNPLHFVQIAARHGRGQEIDALLVFLRGELVRCLRELDEGVPPATVAEIVGGVRESLLPDDRPRLRYDGSGPAERLSPDDAALTRSVLSDLSCNALKEVRDGHRPAAAVGFRREGSRFSVVVADDGPGLPAGWEPAAGTSLARLRHVLHSRQGDLRFTGSPGGGTIVTADWCLCGDDRED